jgi:hypothetical protein
MRNKTKYLKKIMELLIEPTFDLKIFLILNHKKEKY